MPNAPRHGATILGGTVQVSADAGDQLLQRRIGEVHLEAGTVEGCRELLPARRICACRLYRRHCGAQSRIAPQDAARICSGFERSEVPGGTPGLTQSVVPHRYFDAAGVVLRGLEIADQAERATGVDQLRVGSRIGRVVAYRVATAVVRDRIGIGPVVVEKIVLREAVDTGRACAVPTDKTNTTRLSGQGIAGVAVHFDSRGSRLDTVPRDLHVIIRDRGIARRHIPRIVAYRSING